MTRRLMGALCALCMAGPLVAAEIAYVADGSSGEYDGVQGCGVNVEVSIPASGATVEYSESADGPWSASPVAYTNVCTARPVWFRISAEGYATVVDSRPVTVTPRSVEGLVWPVLPAEGYVYDGTAKTPDAGFGDGDPSVMTRDDFEVSYEDNVDAGTAKMVFTGKGNYAGRDVQEFEIGKAENEWTTPPAVADWTYGQTPAEPVSAAKSGTATVTWSSGAKPTLPGSYVATFTVPESRNYRELTATAPFRINAATVAYVADGSSGEYDGVQGCGVNVEVSIPASGATVEYSESADGPWSASPVAYTNVCTARPVWFRISAEGYATVVDSRPVTVTPRSVEGLVWPVLPAEGYVYDGTAKTPDAGFGDGDPSVMTRDDFEVSYEDNVDAGTAKMVFTGKGNYTGRDVQEFEIAKRSVTLTSAGASKVYDGIPLTAGTVTVGGDGFVVGEGAAFTVTGSQTAVGTSDNAFTYELNENVKASNYTVASEFGTLAVTKATFGGDSGDEPGDGAVAEGGLSKFDVSAVYDGLGHVVDADALAAAFRAAMGGEVVVSYSVGRDVPVAPQDGTTDGATDVGGAGRAALPNDGANAASESGDGGRGATALPDDGAWTDNPPAFTNAGEYVVWYRVANPNYEDFVHQAKVVIAPRPATLTSGDGSWAYDGLAHSNATVAAEGFVDGEGVAACNFAEIVDVGTTPNSFDYAFLGGTLAANYSITCVTGTLEVVAPPAPAVALLSADVAWKYLKATGTWFAQVGVTCTNGLAAGIDSLRFEFADRVGADGQTAACLWSTPARAAAGDAEKRDGAVWRRVAFDPALVAEEGARVVYGVSDISASAIPADERTVELYVRRRVDPMGANAAAAGVDDFVGYVVWESGGTMNALPVAAGADASAALARVAGASAFAAPLSAERVNAAIATGAAIAPGASPACRIASFSLDGDVVCGTVETGAAAADGSFSRGAPGANATVVLLGAASPAGPWTELGTVDVGVDGSFEAARPAGLSFFTVRVDAGEAVR